MNPQVIRFGEFEVNLRSGELRRGSERVLLQDQPFQILTMMLERPGGVVTREEIQARLWPDGTTVDFEHSVNAAIKRLRAALGDTADSPRYIETLHRRGYRFVGPLVDSITAGAPSLQAPRDKPRIVVLPFDNLSEECAQDYFSDGLTEEMIAELGRLLGPRVGVIARTSSMRFKNARPTAKEIGRTFEAEYLIEGSVRRSADRVRITAQLIETRGETHIWAQSYDRHLSDVLAVQADVAAAIARSLGELLPGADAASRAGSRHPDAYQAYLKGRFHWHKPGDIGLQAALVYLDEALALDPSFAAAHAARGLGFVSMAEYYRDFPRVLLESARACAEQALRLDPGNSEGNLVLAEVRRAVDWDTDGAESAYQRAFSDNPSFDGGYRHYSVFLAARARLDEAAAFADRACDLDPFCLATGATAALVRYLAGEYQAVIRRCRHILEMEPTFLPARRLSAMALEAMGQHGAAVAALKVEPERQLDPVSLAALGRAMAAAGDRRGALAVRARLERLDRRQFVPGQPLALLDLALGDEERALLDLEAACDQRDLRLDTVAVDPRFEPLRDGPRFRAILNRLRLGRAA